MPAPVVLGIGTGNGAGNSALGRYGVRAGGENFGNDSGFEDRLAQLQGSTHARTAATTDDAVIRNCAHNLESPDDLNATEGIGHGHQSQYPLCPPPQHQSIV